MKDHARILGMIDQVPQEMLDLILWHVKNGQYAEPHRPARYYMAIAFRILSELGFTPADTEAVMAVLVSKPMCTIVRFRDMDRRVIFRKEWDFHPILFRHDIEFTTSWHSPITAHTSALTTMGQTRLECGHNPTVLDCYYAFRQFMEREFPPINP